MATTPRRTPAHRLFVELFFSYYAHCGEPRHDVVAATVSRVRGLYPDYRGEDHPPGLSPINIYKILRGKHRTMPTSDQLGVLLLALQYLAHRAHIRDNDPGCATLPGWQALLSQAKMLDRHQGAKGRSGPEAVLDADPPLRVPAPAPAPDAASSSDARISVAAIEVTPIEAHELVALGHYTRMLALRAADADHRAFYELAVVLGTASAPYNRRAATFAMEAAAAAPGPSPASSLLNADATLNTEQAAVHARVLAHAAAAGDGDGDGEAAGVFAYCADRADNLRLQSQAPRLRD
ncbi:hypothetical protein ETD83_30610 [Actinomadura soli]|uniref:Uncharacterized protein n=1 Tax=Actinomadura soli TaxID=2508997 RepID=A0A5C4J3V1_9ACTN|nr:hypothetical protein [Actinomadura soli]TMQ91507.1 hypothetical protein ETD83_30610 [Actinomadura soli]